MREMKKVVVSLALSVALFLACASALAAGAIFFENFDDGMANRFAEAGGTWSIANKEYVQTAEQPAGPYRSWVNALSEYVRPRRVLYGRASIVGLGWSVRRVYG